MPNLLKPVLLAELKSRYGAIRKIQGSNSLYEIGNGAAKIYIRYSKIHSRKEAFYGLREDDLNKPLWTEIKQVIKLVDGKTCRSKTIKGKRVGSEQKLCSPMINTHFRKLLRKHGWNEKRASYVEVKNAQLIRQTIAKSADDQKAEIEAAGEKPIFSYNQTDFVKSRVALEVQFGKYAFVAYDLFVKHLAFYVRNEIDVGIEVLAMKSLQSQMSSGPGYYEGELYNVIRNGRGVPAVPLVLIGVEP